jgi:hypothetical protein
LNRKRAKDIKPERKILSHIRSHNHTREVKPKKRMESNPKDARVTSIEPMVKTLNPSSRSPWFNRKRKEQNEKRNNPLLLKRPSF